MKLAGFGSYNRFKSRYEGWFQDEDGSRVEEDEGMKMGSPPRERCERKDGGEMPQDAADLAHQAKNKQDEQQNGKDEFWDGDWAGPRFWLQHY